MKSALYPVIEALEARIAPATFIVTSNADSGVGTLREALVFSAASMGGDFIEFNLPGSTEILLITPLPEISSQVEIRGDTQPGFAGVPVVKLNGGDTVATGLDFASGASDSKVVGLHLTDFNGSGLVIESADMTVIGCYLTNNATHGLSASDADNLRIGGPDVADRNVITGNAFAGIYATGGAGLVIQNNYIGVGATGLAADGNSTGGITLETVSNATIGGPLPNVIAANGNHGISVYGSNAVSFDGNLVGVFANQTFSAASRNLGPGLSVDNISNLTVHATQMGTSVNVFSNNTEAGISISSGNTVSIFGSVIGAVWNGMTYSPAPNATGVFVEFSTAVQIGGTGMSAPNVIAFNTEDGVQTDEVIGIKVEGNTFINNGGLPIDLLNDGPTANVDYAEVDPLPSNPTSNYPVLAGAYKDAMGTFHVVGTVDGISDDSFDLVFYGYTAADQKYTLIGTSTVSTDFDGDAFFDVIVGDLAGYDKVSATATSVSYGNTSEMSDRATVGVGIQFDSLEIVEQTEGNTGETVVMFTVSLTNTPTGAISVVISPDATSTATLGTDYTFPPTVLNFGPATTTQTVSFSVTGDGAVEAREYIDFVLGSVMGNGVLLGEVKTVEIVNDDTSLKISPDHRTATWRDVDGDFVTLKATKPILNEANFFLDAQGTLGGEVLQMLDINNAAGGKGTNLTFTAKFDRANNAGDGSVHVGAINAAGLDLGTVVIPGDLAYIVAGDSTLTDGATKSLKVGSMGVLGDTQTAGTGVNAAFNGKLGSLIVRGDFIGNLYSDLTMTPNPTLGGFGSITIGGSFRSIDADGVISTTGAIGSIKIGGSMIGEFGSFPPKIVASGKIGSVTIAGGMFGPFPELPVQIVSDTTIGKVTVGEMSCARIYAQGKSVPGNAAAAVAIASVTVKGTVWQSEIGAGANQMGFFNPDAQIGSITVAGDWDGSSAFAGAFYGDDGQFGTADDVLITPDGGYTDNPNIISKIAKVTIAGHVYGDIFSSRTTGFVAQQIGSLKVSGATYVLQPGKVPNAQPLDLVNLSFFGDVKLREIL